MEHTWEGEGAGLQRWEFIGVEIRLGLRAELTSRRVIKLGWCQGFGR